MEINLEFKSKQFFQVDSSSPSKIYTLLFQKKEAIILLVENLLKYSFW